MTRRKVVCVFSLVFLTVAISAFMDERSVKAQVTPAPVCNEEVRSDFQKKIDEGMGDKDIEELYGYCRNDKTNDAEKAFVTGMVVTNSGSTYFERMNACGYHPQAENVTCDVEVLRPFGYGPYPSGSNEHVLFCLDCNGDGVFDFRTLGSVHVTNNISNSKPSWFFNAHSTTWAAPNMCTVNNGGVTYVRAILSWVARPTHCQYKPIWGNQIDFTTRRDP